jgi:quinol monooxygenase YgiN
MQTQTQTRAVPAAVVVTHEVESYETWKPLFDQHASARQHAGIVAAHINRNAANPNLLHVYLAAGSREQLNAFLGNADVKKVMQQAGVKGAPQVAQLTPTEDCTVKDRALSGAIVKHRVANYEAWKAAFDAHAGARAAAGVIGHAVNRSAEDPNLVVVYLQAESLDALRGFGASADLQQVMQKAGVQGAPEITLVNGAAWTN